MGWESAKTRSAALPVEVRPAPRPWPENPESEIEYSDDEIMLCRHYDKALFDLAAEDKRFALNLKTYRRWTADLQLKWIYTIEQQALDGLDTIGIHVVARVVINRLD